MDAAIGAAEERKEERKEEMKAYQSVVEQRGAVPMPAHLGERIYMREFRKADGLPSNLTRWQPTIDAMLDGIDTDGPIYLMIDQGVVRSGASHRRPGVHIDGYWQPAMSAHGGGGGYVGRSERSGSHGGGRHASGRDSWSNADYVEHEGILLASSVTAARGFAGQFTGQPGVGGDCKHIDITGLREIVMEAGQVYAGNVTMLHESLPVEFDCLRTVIRLNVPGWTPQ
jgi:hypothetical protein